MSFFKGFPWIIGVTSKEVGFKPYVSKFVLFCVSIGFPYRFAEVSLRVGLLCCDSDLLRRGSRDKGEEKYDRGCSR